jgi:hypothetical protein
MKNILPAIVGIGPTIRWLEGKCSLKFTLVNILGITVSWCICGQDIMRQVLDAS